MKAPKVMLSPQSEKPFRKLEKAGQCGPAFLHPQASPFDLACIPYKRTGKTTLR